MIRNLLKDSGTLSKLAQLSFAFLFFSLFVLALSDVLLGNTESFTVASKLMMMLQRIFMFVIPPVLLAYLWSNKPYRYLKFNKPISFSGLIIVGVFMLLVIPFINFLSYYNNLIELPDSFSALETWMRSLEAQAEASTAKLLNVNDFSDLIFNILLVAVLPALGEELFFRGSLQTILSEKGKVILAVWISAVVFSAIHFQFYGFVPRMLLGACFGYLLLWSGNLWIPIAAHFINNAVAVVFYYLKYNEMTTLNLDTIGTGETRWLGVVSGILSMLLLLYIYRFFKTQSRR